MKRWVWIREISQHMFEILIDKFEWVWSKWCSERAWDLFVCEEFVCSGDFHL